MSTVTTDEARRLGADRVLEPRGVLPQPAERLDAGGPVRSDEFEIAVERLVLDSTSHRQIHEAADGDPERMAARVLEIVGARGKMHNPVTDSGGIALGAVTAVGERFPAPPATGDRIVTLASLTLTPLRLVDACFPDPDYAQVEVTGMAYICARAPWGELPGDLPEATALEMYDVYGAGSHTRELAPQDGVVCVLGVGHAGKLALAAARDTMRAGTLIAVDRDPGAVARVAELGLCDIAVAADLRDPLATINALREAGAPAADLTVVVVNAGGCEPTAILLTRDEGTVLFYSMATSFQTSALTADGMSSNVRMLVGNGYAPDRGAYALDLLRQSPALRAALSVPEAQGAGW